MNDNQWVYYEHIRCARCQCSLTPDGQCICEEGPEIEHVRGYRRNDPLPFEPFDEEDMLPPLKKEK